MDQVAACRRGRRSAAQTTFCHHAIQQDDLLIIPNTLGDARFRGNMFVTGERSDAGVQLRVCRVTEKRERHIEVAFRGE